MQSHGTPMLRAAFPCISNIGDTGNSMINYLELPVGDKAPEIFNVVIEIPAEGINKYE